MKTLPVKKLVIAISLFSLSITIGMTGFMLIENFRWEDAFYMAVITIGSVGFTEVHELSTTGRMFTSFYIIFNLGIYAYILAVIGQYFFEGEIRNIFNKIRTQKKIDRMNNHIIICGYGRNGSKAAEELLKNKVSVVIIEKERAPIVLAEETRKVAFIEGNATQDDVLISAGIHKASAIITTLPNDADNVFIALTAKEINPRIKIISRASSVQSEKKLKRAGADHVVMPEVIGGFHMASLITQPDIIPFTNLIENNLSEQLLIEEITSEELLVDLRNKSIDDLNIKANRGIIVLGYKRINGDFIFNPDGNIKLQGKEALIVIGKKMDIEQFKKNYLIQM